MRIFVRLPRSRQVATWRPARYFRVLFVAGAVVVALLGVWQYLIGSSTARGWAMLVQFVLAGGILVFGLTPRLVLFTDSLYVRGHFFGRVIPLEHVATVEPSRSGLVVWWGDWQSTDAPLIGQEDLRGRWHPTRNEPREEIITLILNARDVHLREQALPDPPEPPPEEVRRERDLRQSHWEWTRLLYGYRGPED